MKLKRKHRGNLITLGIVVCLIAIFYYTLHRYNKSLLKNKKTTVGRVERTEVNPPSSYIRIWYTYQIDDKQFEDRCQLKVTAKFRKEVWELIGNKDLLVVYDSTDFDNCDLPMTNRDFIRYNIAKPDSLLDMYKSVDSLAALDR